MGAHFPRLLEQTALSAFRLAWVACCALALLCQTRLLFGLPLVPGRLDAFIGAATIFAYHFDAQEPLRRYVAWISGLCSGALFWRLPPDVCRHMVVPVLLWLAYYGAFIKGKKGARGLIALKPLVIAFVWSWVTLSMPALAAGKSDAGLLFIGRSAFIFSLALIYDALDAAYDRQMQFDTLALRLGPRRTLLLHDLLLGFSAVCALFAAATGFISTAPAIALATGALCALFVGRRIVKLPAGQTAFSEKDIIARKAWTDGMMCWQTLLVAFAAL